jgi:hypothetical protein
MVLDVLFASYRPKMLGSNASPVAANVIYFQALRDRPLRKFEGHAMGFVDLAIPAEIAVAVAQ